MLCDTGVSPVSRILNGGTYVRPLSRMIREWRQGARSRATGVARLSTLHGPWSWNAPSLHRTWRRNKPLDAPTRIARERAPPQIPIAQR
jgi:hypothetical protein